MSTIKPAITRILAASLGAALLLVTPGFDAAAQARGSHKADLSVAADSNVGLLAMGGYGHSRLQERILGGVTRAMFESMTVPVLMSH